MGCRVISQGDFGSGRVKVYYKLSNYDNIRGVIEHESVNELFADRLWESSIFIIS